MNSLFARGMGDWYGESSWVVGSEEGSDESADIFVDETLVVVLDFEYTVGGVWGGGVL